MYYFHIIILQLLCLFLFVNGKTYSSRGVASSPLIDVVSKDKSAKKSPLFLVRKGILESKNKFEWAIVTVISKLFRLPKSSKASKKEIVIKDIDDNFKKIIAPSIEKQPWYMAFLPIYPNELPKFLSLSMMMFWIVFVFTMTRDTKDALIVTNCGAEAIAFLKVYGVVPAAAAFMIVYAKAANTFSPRTLFYLTLAPFFLFYSLFAFVLYPLRNILHPIHMVVPEGGMKYAVNLLRYWTYSLYYIVSELWGSAGIPLLFWSCANDVIKIEQAKRIYPLMSLVGNLGPILSGICMSVVGECVSSRIHDDELAFEMSLKLLTSMMMVAGGLVGGLHWYVHKLSDQEKMKDSKDAVKNLFVKVSEARKEVKKATKVDKAKKPQVSLSESLTVLASNNYLRNIATLVLSYGLTIEFTEIMWKAAVKKAFPEKNEYLKFQGRYSAMVGMSATVMMFAGSRIVKSLGWKAGAIMTPAAMGLLALPFFAAIIFGGLDSPSSLLIIVYVGLLQNVLSKATKYAVFDPTKEMTYIPLDKDSKTKGKAAIDVLGARLGKSGAALVQQLLVVMLGSIVRGAPVIAVFFYLIIAAWINAVNSLAPKFEEKSKQMDGK